MVKHSYGHGFMDDCGSTTGWSKADNGNTSTFTIDNDDYFKINVTVCGGAEESKVVNDNNIGASTTLYPQIRWRYKCSNASIKAKIIAEYSDASLQTVLADVNSTVWTNGNTALTAAKTLDHITVYADHAVGILYYDFLLVFAGDFTLPNVAHGMNMDLAPREAILDIFGRDTDITQGGGTKNALINIGCDLDQGGSTNDWQRPQGTSSKTDSVDAEVYLEMLHNLSSEPWQWFQSEVGHQFKVTVHPEFKWISEGGGSASRRLDLILKEYSLGSKADESYIERYGIS